jgi:hypothetical protein
MTDYRTPDRGNTVWAWIGGIAVAVLIIAAVLYGVNSANRPIQGVSTQGSPAQTAPATAGTAPAPSPAVAPSPNSPTR